MTPLSLIQIGDPRLEVDIQTLEPGDPFRFDNLEGQWIYGHLIFKNASRVRAVIYDQGRKRRAWDRADSDESGMVKQGSLGDNEMNLPLSMKVESLKSGRYTPTLRIEKETEMEEQQVETETEEVELKPPPDTVKAAGLKAKYAHQQKQWALARQSGDTPKAGVALQRIKAIEQEAEAAGVELPVYDVDRAEAPTTQTRVKMPIIKLTKAQQEEDRQIQRAKEKASNAASKGVNLGVKATKPDPKPKKSTKTHDCLCGCGKETLSIYAPGHDARVKGILLKVERGELGKDAVPETVSPFVKWTGKWKTESFRITAAPVKIPGRDEVENTSLQAMEALDV